MNIALIVRRLDTRGGTQRQALALAHTLKERGNNVVVYTFRYQPSETFSESLKGIRVVALDQKEGKDYSHSIPFLPKFFSDYLNDNRCARALARCIDVDTHVLNPHDQVSYRVAVYFKKKVKQIPSVWMMNDMPTKYASMIREREVYGYHRTSLLKRIIYKFFDFFEIRCFIKPQDAIVVLDHRDKKWAQEFFKKDAFVVRSGLDHNRFTYRERTLSSNKRINILTTSIFLPHRRFEDTLRAIRMLLNTKEYDIQFSIVGGFHNKGYVEFIRKVIKEEKLQHNVSLLGAVSDEKLQALYRDADIFVFVSHMQSWGIAVFEALASGIPTVVSETTGASEILKNGLHAITVPPKNPRRIADALNTLITDPDLYQSLSREGRALVLSEISWEQYSKKMEAIMEHVMR